MLLSGPVMPPVRAFHVGPPLKVIVSAALRDRSAQTRPSPRPNSRAAHLGILLCRRSFRDGDVTGRFDELLETAHSSPPFYQ